MNYQLGIFDTIILILYAVVLIGMGIYFLRKSKTSFSVIVIVWGTFLRDLPENFKWLECNIYPIIIGAVGTTGLVALALVFVVINTHRNISTCFFMPISGTFDNNILPNYSSIYKYENDLLRLIYHVIKLKNKNKLISVQPIFVAQTYANYEE